MSVIVSTGGRRAALSETLSAWWYRVATTPVAVSFFTITFLLCAALRPLSVPDEGRYLDIARWMPASGDWVVPRLAGMPFQHKPPLFFWIEGLAVSLFGTGLLAGRLASMLGAALAVGSVWWLARKFHGRAEAFWSATVLATSPLFFGAAQYASLDMLVAGVMTLTIALAVAAATAEPAKARPLWIAAYAAAGFGLLAKGLIGIVIPGAVFVLWSLAERRPRRILDAISVPGLAVFALIVVPWFWLMERRVPGFAATFFLHHHVARFVETKFNNAIGPWFYPVVFLAGTVPWTASAAIVAWRRNRQGTLAVGPAGWSPSIRLALVWFVTVMVFFSIPRSKLAGYILPALPAFALLLGPVVAHVFDRALAAAVALALCCALAVASPLILKPTPDTLVLSIAREIRDEDRLIFFNRHFHSTAYRLARTSVIPIAGRWEFPAASFPDNQYRELIEGAEAMGADYKSILLDEAALRDTIARPGVTWIVTEQVYLAHLQNLGAKDIAAQNKGFAVLRVAR